MWILIILFLILCFLYKEFLIYFFVKMVAHLIYNIAIKNPVKLDKNKAYIITSNHVSFIDWMLIISAFNRPVRFVMDSSYYNMPLLKYIFRYLKAIPIASKKTNEKVYEESFSFIKQLVNEKEVIGIFPEGQITRNGDLNPFKPGIARILAENNVAVIPIALCNVYGSSFSRKYNYFVRILLGIFNFRRKIIINIGNEQEMAESNSHQLLENKTKNLLLK